MTEATEFGFSGQARSDSGSNSDAVKTDSNTLETPNFEAAKGVLKFVSHGDGLFEMPLRDDENEVSPVSAAVEADLPETLADAFEKLSEAEIEKLTFEAIFDADLGETKYISQPSLVTLVDRNEDGEISEFDPKGEFSEDGQLSDYDIETVDQFIEEFADDYDDSQLYRYGKEEKGVRKKVVDPELAAEISGSELDTNLGSDARKLFNAEYFSEIWEEFGEGAGLAFGKGKSYNNDGELEQLSNVAVWVREEGFTAEDMPDEWSEGIEAYENGDIEAEEIPDFEAEDDE